MLPPCAVTDASIHCPLSMLSLRTRFPPSKVTFFIPKNVPNTLYSPLRKGFHLTGHIGLNLDIGFWYCFLYFKTFKGRPQYKQWIKSVDARSVDTKVPTSVSGTGIGSSSKEVKPTDSQIWFKVNVCHPLPLLFFICSALAGFGSPKEERQDFKKNNEKNKKQNTGNLESRQHYHQVALCIWVEAILN